MPLGIRVCGHTGPQRVIRGQNRLLVVRPSNLLLILDSEGKASFGSGGEARTNPRKKRRAGSTNSIIKRSKLSINGIRAKVTQAKSKPMFASFYCPETDQLPILWYDKGNE